MPSLAQRGRAGRGPGAQRPPRMQQNRPPRQARNETRAAQQERRQNREPGNARGNSANRPNGPNGAERGGGNPNRPPSAYNPPPAKKFNDLNPQERQKVLQNYNRLKNMSPQQRQEFTDRANTWKHLTPAQRDHIRNDIMPKWRQMPVDRRQAIKQRLHILQNMPEFARNERLNDPNFTRGMSDEDRATLRDLSHMHVGAPDPPGE